MNLLSKENIAYRLLLQENRRIMALSPVHLLSNRNFIFLLALILGFLWDTGAQYTQRLILPGLAVVMTISSMGISIDTFRSPKSLLKFTILGIFCNFILHGVVLISLSALIIKDQFFWNGFILLAAVPPAVAVIPFALFLRGNIELVLLGTIGAYLGALFLTPLIALVFLGTGFISPMKLLLILGELIIGPLVVSRILVATGLSKKIDPYKGPITNWSFFLVIYIITGLNRSVFLQQPLSIVPVIIIAVITTFVLGWFIEKIGSYFGYEKATLTSFLLLSIFKNYGLSGALALVFFNPQTAVPGTVTSAVSILYFIWLEMLINRNV
jgi:BASS family bile acid:Na+ symporter